MKDGYRGYAFGSMSDEFLIECFDELCELTHDCRANPDDWIGEWLKAKVEILLRMRENKDAI